MAYRSESEIKKEILTYLKAHPKASVFPISTTGISMGAGKLRKHPGRKGTPDILLCWRSNFGLGLFVGIEVKSPTGKLSKDQIECCQDILDKGGVALEARSLDDVIPVLAEL